MDRLQAELDQRDQIIHKDLGGQIVRISRYPLPLEMGAGGVKEFLLVPYVGACIHTPPPLPNQMVFAKLCEEYEVTSLYDPVWITGQIRVEQARAHTPHQRMRIQYSQTDPFQCTTVTTH